MCSSDLNELIDRFGADAIRVYILFQGPADQDIDWTPDGIEATARFLRRLWRVVQEASEQPESPKDIDTPLARKAHETIARVTDDIVADRSDESLAPTWGSPEGLRYGTAAAAFNSSIPLVP